MVSHYSSWRWWTVALRGLAAILLGILSLSRPGITLVSLVLLFGAYAVVDGVLALSIGLRRTRDMRSALIARGIISIFAGALAIAWPQITTFWLMMVIGFWAIVGGIAEIMAAVRMRKMIAHEWMLGLEGALSIAFGIALVISPIAGAIVIGMWVGAYALVLGGMLVASALRMRTVVHQHPELAAG